MTVKTFPSKILLFGEYLLLKGGQGLAIPYPGYSGHFELNEGQSIDDRLVQFANYIRRKEIPYVDISTFEADINQGLRFVSNIPLGYGCGSSGALTAATLSRYPSSELNNSRLWTALKELESFFHGSSSGIDPLISYVNKSVHIKEGLTKLLDHNVVPHDLFLYDSGHPRQTGPLVEIFKNRYEEDAKVFDEIDRLNASLIASWLDPANATNRTHLMKELSNLQLEAFDFAIEADTRRLWQTGLSSDQYFFKLCGAGGGGFYLVYTTSGEGLSFDVLDLSPSSKNSNRI